VTLQSASKVDRDDEPPKASILNFLDLKLPGPSAPIPYEWYVPLALDETQASRSHCSNRHSQRFHSSLHPYYTMPESIWVSRRAKKHDAWALYSQRGAHSLPHIDANGAFLGAAGVLGEKVWVVPRSWTKAEADAPWSIEDFKDPVAIVLERGSFL
jgi:hypothetical protein